MSLWEYKVITSGKGGFATPALLEKFLNDLGREEWEIIEFRTAADNALAFTGLARRTTQRDWTLEDAAAAAAKVEAEKLRAEFAAKFQAATSSAPAAEERASSFLDEKLAPDDGFRKPIDTSRDDEPEGGDDDKEEKEEKDEWDQLDDEDALPTFFDALKPHMRRNQRGAGTSVGVDYLAKKWGLDEGDIKGALVECGLQIPADENAKPVYVEYDGDLYWVNINRRGEIWINEREKPRPVFRIVQGNKVTPETTEEPAAEAKQPKPEQAPRQSRHEVAAPAAETPEAAQPKPEQAKADGSGAALPEGPALLEKIRPMMRRNRRGSGGSGSASFLARALKCQESELVAGFVALGLVSPATAADPSVNVEVGGDIWWLNKDSRGGLWINGREKRDGEVLKPGGTEPGSGEAAAVPSAETPAPTPASESGAVGETSFTPTASSAPMAEPPLLADCLPPTAPTEATPSAPAETTAAPVSESAAPLAAIRLLLKETRTGAFAGKVERVAGELGKTPEELVATLVGAGLKVPEKPREKPAFVEHAGEIYWFNLNAKNELWVNAKASKFAEGEEANDEEGEAGEKRPSRRGGRGRGRSAGPEESSPTPPTPPVV